MFNILRLENLFNLSLPNELSVVALCTLGSAMY